MRHPLSTVLRRRTLLGPRFVLGFVVVMGLATAMVVQTSCARLTSTYSTGNGTSGGGPSPGSDAGPEEGDSEAPEPDLATQPRETFEPGETILFDGGIPEGGLPAVTKMACSDSLEQLSHTRGILPDGGLLDISQATGYTPDPTIPGKAMALLASGTSNPATYAHQMQGTPPMQGSMLSFSDIYRTLDDTTSGIKGMLFRDGPRGVNLASPDYLGAFGAPPVNLDNIGSATVFPVTVARAATWDLDLETQIGEDLADEVIATGNYVTISPTVNILRNPAWGRAQETYGEDSFAIGRMGTAYVDGVQVFEPGCVKHLAAYNIEDGRFNQISVMDSQTLHEIYGRHFEMIVQEAAVACVMASYNSIQVTDLDNISHKDTSNSILLDGMLRGTFGFKGFVMSDFWAMPNQMNPGLMPAQYASAAVDAINAGLDMEMPWDMNFANITGIATQAGSGLTLQQLQTSATRIVEQKLRFNFAAIGPSQKEGLYPPTSSLGATGVIDNENHLADAERQAEEAMVLLKNGPVVAADAGLPQDSGSSQPNVLPIDRSRVHSIAVIGAAVKWNLADVGQNGITNFATDLRLGDLGSSRVIPAQSNSPGTTSNGPYAGIAAAAGSGITVTAVNVAEPNDPPDAGVTVGAAQSAAQNADFVVLVAGLTPEDEGEEYTGAGDRIDSTGKPNYSLDVKSGSGFQDMLISTIAAMGKPMAVVLEAGSAVNMPWVDSVPAVVMAWYPGDEGATALGRLLFGDVNFSGKLPITWPKSETDEPVFNQGTTNGGSTMMGYYLGYRWFDQQNITPLFAYGSGLSYTTFKYEYLGVPCSTVSQHGVVDVQVAITNTGTVPGNETSFLFVSYPSTSRPSSLHVPVKELKGFHRTKQPVQPGQTVLFTIPVRVQDLKYWNSAANPPAWNVETGSVKIMVGPSSDNLPLMDTVMVSSTQ